MKNNQTISQFLGIKVEEGKPFIITHNGNEVYHEDYTGYWSRWVYDVRGGVIYYGDSEGDWWKCEYDSRGNETYFESSSGYWLKRECDTKGNQTYYEDSDGYIEDNRPKELTMDEIAEKFNIPVTQLKIKK